jgi:NADPH:quinone reductase-like Zn-dependent oxidoreductase
MRLVREELPDPQPNEVLVEVRAIGLNFADIFAIMGLYSATPKGSFVPGLEYAGVVRAVGNAVQHLRVGERVMGVIRFGGYTTHLLIDANYVQTLPDDWSFEEGASFLVQTLTAYYALKPLGALPEDGTGTVLIHSAAGGVGIAANRIAKQFGAYTIGTIGTPAKSALLKQEGYDRVIVRPTNGNAREFRRELDAALGERTLNLVLDSLGGSIMKASYDALAPAGRLVCFGSAHLAFQGARPNYLPLVWKYLQRPKFDPLAMIETNKSILGFNLIWLWDNVPQMKRLLADITALSIAKPLVGHTFAFEDLRTALTTFQSGTTTGKVVVLLPS